MLLARVWSTQLFLIASKLHTSESIDIWKKSTMKSQHMKSCFKYLKTQHMKWRLEIAATWKYFTFWHFQDGDGVEQSASSYTRSNSCEQ